MVGFVKYIFLVFGCRYDNYMVYGVFGVRFIVVGY